MILEEQAAIKELELDSDNLVSQNDEFKRQAEHVKWIAGCSQDILKTVGDVNHKNDVFEKLKKYREENQDLKSQLAVL